MYVVNLLRLFPRSLQGFTALFLLFSFFRGEGGERKKPQVTNKFVCCGGELEFPKSKCPQHAPRFPLFPLGDNSAFLKRVAWFFSFFYAGKRASAGIK